MYSCTQCLAQYPEDGTPYRCPTCGGLFDCDLIQYDPKKVCRVYENGIWDYRHTFGLPEPIHQVSLGEGNTPLVCSIVSQKKIAFKCEFSNPTGSFKDRGTTTLVSFLSSRGVDAVVEDSSGNAGASLAAYTARAGMKASIYMPDSATGPKRKQIVAYGADIVAVSGEREKATTLVQQAVQNGSVYASHAYLPFNLPGYATIAYEIVDQLGGPPGVFICPVGQGGLFLGAARGFIAMRNAGLIQQIPKMIGVQALACSPLANMFTLGSNFRNSESDIQTIAEGVRIHHPLRAQAILNMVRVSGGWFLTVPESDILPGRDELAHRGFYVETTSALVWSALTQTINLSARYDLREPIVVVLTGSGLKSGE